MHGGIKARFHYKRERVFFVLLLRLALASILCAERSIEETKNALFCARSGNEPLSLQCARNLYRYDNRKYEADLKQFLILVNYQNRKLRWIVVVTQTGCSIFNKVTQI